MVALPATKGGKLLLYSSPVQPLNSPLRRAVMSRKVDDDTDAVPPLPEGWTRCQVYMHRKRRYCRQQQMPNSRFCGNHQSHEELVDSLKDDSKSGTAATPVESKKRRVQCPLDPSHDVAAHKLEQHLRKCPSLRKQQELEQASYFCRDINKRGYGMSKYNLEIQDRHSLAWAQRIACAVLQIHQRLFSGEDLSEKDLKTLTLEKIESALCLEDYSKYELDAGLPRAVEVYRVKSGGPKHLHQQASLLGHLRRLGALPEPKDRISESMRDTKKQCTAPRTFFDMGAGRGMLGMVAAGVSAVTEPTNLILVERSGSRSKADTILRNVPDEALPEDVSRCMNLRALKWSRIQCDLAHVRMETVVKEQKVSDIHVIAKHLCGVGTDLALKALEPVKQQLSTCLLATCCHGVCNWEDYVGRDCLRRLFATEAIYFGKEEFELLRRWSAATCLPNKNGAEEHSPAKIAGGSKDEGDARSPYAVGRVVESLGLACGVQGLGRCCQRLIDQGRCEYIQNVLFCNESSATTSLVHYVLPQVTPQNAVVTGRKQTGSSC